MFRWKLFQLPLFLYKIQTPHNSIFRLPNTPQTEDFEVKNVTRKGQVRNRGIQWRNSQGAGPSQAFSLGNVCWPFCIHSTPTWNKPQGGALSWKGGTGMSGGQDPFFMPLSPLFRSPVAAWLSSLDPTLSKNYKFWLLREKFAKKLNNFSSAA